MTSDTASESTSKRWDAELYEAQHSFVWRFGEALLDMLNPSPGEQILDLGCGTGQLTSKIAERGADVIGLDSSPEMIGQARQNFPKLRFVLGDAGNMQFDQVFDAVFSNAALHWMLDAAAVASGVARALKPNGRFVAEMGGKGNIRAIENAIARVLDRYTRKTPPSRTYYPSTGEYAALLEGYGLEVRSAELFDRPTPLEGENGMEQWLRQFKNYYFEALPATVRSQAIEETVKEMRPVLYRDGIWLADYRRLRISAVRT